MRIDVPAPAEWCWHYGPADAVILYSGPTEDQSKGRIGRRLRGLHFMTNYGGY
jgi:hypothetical protein